MDRNELVEKAAQAIRSAYIEYCDAIDPVLDAQVEARAEEVCCEDGDVVPDV